MPVSIQSCGGPNLAEILGITRGDWMYETEVARHITYDAGSWVPKESEERNLNTAVSVDARLKVDVVLPDDVAARVRGDW